MKKIKLFLFFPLLLVTSCATDDVSSIDSSDSFSSNPISSESSSIDDSSSGNSSSSIIYTWNAPTYVWNSDNSTCTATRTRQDDDSIFETETSDSNYAVIEEATCHSLGVGRYSVTFNNENFVSQTKDVDIEMASHDYGTPTYEWESDYSSCTASVACINEGCNHVINETIDSIIIDQKEVTCLEDGYITYQVTFTNPLFETQEETEELNHTGDEHDWQFVEYVSYATFDENDNVVPGKARYRCSKCQETKLVDHYNFEWEIPLN